MLVVKVYFRDAAERDKLATEFDAGENPTGNGSLTVYADRPTYQGIVARGLRVEIDEQATTEINTPVAFGNNPKERPTSPDTFYGGYRTVEENYAYMDQLVAAYPTLAQKVDIGDSWCKTHPGSCTAPAPTWNGYDLYALHITNQAIPGPKPVYWFETGIHSREIATTEVADRFMSQLLDGYATDPDSHWLVDWHDIWVMPHVNPDGHHMVEAGGGSPYLQRKNGDRDDGCTSWPPGGGQLGTDNNRNFPFLWNCCGGSSGSACNETYHGPSAGSEEETQAIVNQIRLLIPDQRGPNITDAAPITTTGVYQSMHSNASLNLFPWGFQTTPHAPNDADLRNIGHHMEATNAFPTGNNYTTGQPPEVLYAVDGDTADWGYGELGAASFTTEVGGSTFFPTYSTMNSSIWPQNRGALIYQAKIARTPYLLAHGPDTKDTVSVPITVTQGTQAVLTATINYSWTANSFAQNVGAAEYYIDNPPWAGGTGIPMSGSFGSSQTVPVNANVDTTGLSVGRHLLLLRGRGVNTYGGFQTWGPMTGVFLDVLPSGGSTSTPTATRTSTPLPTNTTQASNTPTMTRTATPIASTNTPTLTRTATAVAATNTPTSTGSPTRTPTGPPPNTATSTRTPTRTSTIPAAPTDTPTHTPTVPTGPTDTPSSTVTPGGPSFTPTNTPIITDTPTAGPTPTVCPVNFTDVPVGSTFYEFIRCLACRGIINGYADGTFRPNNNVTRGQLSKIVSNSAGFSDPATQMFEDVPPGSTFFDFVGRLASRGYINGYPCGGPGEPCVPPGNLPYFRPNANATRGQISKIVSNAAGFIEPVSGQTFEDVPPGSTFYEFIERLASRGVMSGYPCGSVPTEPCVPPENRPYFRPNNNATRGQTSKIVSNTFFPACVTPARP
jgi:hypothetical protein